MSTCSATASALPSVIHVAPRRRFLAGLATLPLIGGGLELLGQPSAVAEPVTPDLLEAYKSWLRNERYYLAHEMAEMPHFRQRYAPFELRPTTGHAVATDFSAWEQRVAYSKAILGVYNNINGVFNYHDCDGPGPSTRAALVLSAVGFDWRGGAHA